VYEKVRTVPRSGGRPHCLTVKRSDCPTVSPFYGSTVFAEIRVTSDERPRLDGGFLLGQAVEGAEAPDQVYGVDPDDRAVGEEVG
jgi:hypothetical protein